MLHFLTEDQLNLRKLTGDPAHITIKTFGSSLVTVTNIAVALSGSIALIFLIYGGLAYLTSGGDSQATEKAKNIITWSIVGLIVILAAYATVRYVADNFIAGSPFASS